MHMTLEIQEVVFKFSIDSNNKLGLIGDMISKLALEIRQSSGKEPRPMIRFAVLAMADEVRLDGKLIKSKAPTGEPLYQLIWDVGRKAYTAQPAEDETQVLHAAGGVSVKIEDAKAYDELQKDVKSMFTEKA